MALPIWTQSGPNQYNYAINGIPFLAATSNENPYARQSAKVQKDQSDTSKDLGEQSLGNWWYRSQSSFDLGAGAKFFDVSQDPNLSRRFFDSHGVDVLSDIGEVRLQRKATLVNAKTDSKQFTSGYDVIVPAYDGSPAYQEIGVLHAHGSTLEKYTSTGTIATINWGGSSTILDLATNGSYYFVLATDGIYYGALPGVAPGIANGSKLYTVAATTGTITWAKERIVATIDSAIYLLAPGAGALPAPLYTSNTIGWKWSAIADGPNSIYFAGYVGDKSFVYRSSLADNGLDLNSPSVVAEMPHGEVAYSMITYMGTYIIIGTNVGVRVGVIASDGTVVVGPLSIETNNNVRSLRAFGNFVWVGGAHSGFEIDPETNAVIPGKTGIYRIDLSKTITNNSLQFPYQKDLYGHTVSYLDADEVLDITPMGSSRRIAFTIANKGLVVEAASEKVETGWLETGKIRMDTSENKVFQYLKVVNTTQDGFISVKYRTPDNKLSDTSLARWYASPSIETIPDTITDVSGISSANMEGSDGLPYSWLSYRFTLERGHDAVLGLNSSPVLLSYQVKANPSGIKQRNIQVALLCYRNETPVKGKMIERSVYDRIKALETVEEKGSVIVFQDLGTGEQRLCIIDSIAFVAKTIGETRPAQENPGGILTISLRTVDSAEDM